MALYKHRCSNRQCRARHTFPKHISEYQRPPKCRVCGGREFSLDTYRTKKGSSEGRDTCYCDGAWYPHRKGSVLLCIHHPIGPSEDDWKNM